MVRRAKDTASAQGTRTVNSNKKAKKGNRQRNKLQKKQEVTDKELIKQIIKGSEEAFNEIVSRYEAKVFNLAIGFTRDIEDAEEVLQDVFVTVYRKIASFQGKSAFSSWLYRITVNAAFMKLRKRKQNHSVPVEEISSNLENQWIEKKDNPMLNCDSQAINNQLKDVISKAVNRLPDEYRIVFMLRDVDGLSNDEVAEILGLSTPAVKSRLHRARLMLRKKLSRFYQDYYDTERILAPGPKLLRKAGNGE